MMCSCWGETVIVGAEDALGTRMARMGIHTPLHQLGIAGNAVQQGQH